MPNLPTDWRAAEERKNKERVRKEAKQVKESVLFPLKWEKKRVKKQQIYQTRRWLKRKDIQLHNFYHSRSIKQYGTDHFPAVSQWSLKANRDTPRADCHAAVSLQ